MSADLAAIFTGCSPDECCARLRELRAMSLLLCGRKHPLTHALAAAVGDPGALDAALAELERLPALPRRRLLCTLAAVLP